MKEIPTPLTDAVLSQGGVFHTELVNRARQLERDRHELKEALRDLEITVSQSYGLMHHAQTIQARALLERMKP